MKKFNMIIDVEKCFDCNSCFLACKDEFVDNDFPGYCVAQPKHGHRWVNIMRKERGQTPMVDMAYLPIPCMHCDKAPCISEAEGGAVYKRDDGIVIIDPEKAKGQKALVDSCPYGAIWWNEEKGVAQKCSFCAHLIDQGWEEPRCVQACSTQAMQVVFAENSEMEKMVDQEELEVLNPEYKTKPRIYYKNLYRYQKCFLGGTVAAKINGLEECVKGASVSLKRDAKKINQAITDCFGDFKFDKLDQDSGKYTLEITCEGYPDKIVEVDLQTSLNVGTINL